MKMPEPATAAGELRSLRLSLRPLTPEPGDAAALQRVFTAAGDHFLTVTGRPEPDADAAARELRACASTPGRAVALLSLADSGEPVGAVGWWARHPEPDVALLGMLLVIPEQRGRGLAREALSALGAHLAGRGMRRLRAAAGAGDERAHAILRALGFQAMDERRHIGLDRGRVMIALFEAALP